MILQVPPSFENCTSDRINSGQIIATFSTAGWENPKWWFLVGNPTPKSPDRCCFCWTLCPYDPLFPFNKPIACWPFVCWECWNWLGWVGLEDKQKENMWLRTWHVREKWRWNRCYVYGLYYINSKYIAMYIIHYHTQSASIGCMCIVYIWALTPQCEGNKLPRWSDAILLYDVIRCGAIKRVW